MPFDPNRLEEIKKGFNPQRLEQVKKGVQGGPSSLGAATLPVFPPSINTLPKTELQNTVSQPKEDIFQKVRGAVSNFGVDGAKESLKSIADLIPGIGTAIDSIAMLDKLPDEAKQKIIDTELGALPIAGGVTGAVIGSSAGPAGSIGGATLGGSAGESARQIAARALGRETPETSLEAAKEIGMEGLFQGAGETFGLGVIYPAIKYGGKILKKPFQDLFQIITKIKPEDASTLFKNPKAILPETWDKAQASWRKAAEESGLPVDDVSPEIINALKKDARSTVFDTFEKMSAGEAVTAAEAQTAKQALDIALMPAAKTERNKPMVALFGKMRKTFSDRIAKESPKLAKANKEYGIAKAGKRFRSLFPRNLDDSPAYFRSTVLPSILLGSGLFDGDVKGGAVNAAAAIGATSPISLGTIIALAGLMKGKTGPVRSTLTSSLAKLAKEKFAN